MNWVALSFPRNDRTMKIDEGVGSGDICGRRKNCPSQISTLLRNCGDSKKKISAGVNVLGPDCVRELSKHLVLDKTLASLNSIHQIVPRT
jgi:hypothetical protein